MANTTNLVIEKPVPGGSNNVWGTTLNTGADSFDTAIAGTLSKSVAGSANVSLTDAEALNANHIYTGALTGSIAVHVPIKSRRYQVFNNTTGSYTLKVKTSSETNGTTVNQGTTMVLFCDATSVIDGTSGAGQTSVSDFTANNLKVPVCASVTNLVAATGSFTTKVSGVAGEFSGVVSAATFDGNLLGNVTGNITGNVTGDVDGATGSYSACVSATNFVAATGSFTTKVSGVAAEFSGAVSVGTGFWAAGGAVFNEAGADADFRVESDAITDILKVDAGNDTTRIKGFIYEQQTVEASVSSTTHTIDCALGNVHDLTFLNNCSIGFSNVAPDGRAQDVTMIIRRTAAASIAFNPIILTAGGVTLGLADTSGRTDVLTMFTVDGGTSFYTASSFLAAATVAA